MNECLFLNSNEIQKKDLKKLHEKFIKEYKEGEIKNTTLEEIRDLHNIILHNKNKSVVLKIKNLSEKVIGSMAKCHELSKQEKSFVEKTMIFFDRSR